MSHPPLSVVVTASGSPDDFLACLQALRPALGMRDEAVCVLPPDRPDLRRVLPAAPWLTVVADEPTDQAARWSAGVAATTHPVVVLLDGDVIGSAHWLEQVARVFADPEVVAAGPRCHRSYGPQAADLPDQAKVGTGSFKAYAREWRQQHRDLVEVDRLGPVCVAVRRAALERAGGPSLDMPYAALAAQGRIVVVDGALVAHVGTDRCALRSSVPAQRPLVSASMIVKDEQDVLATSLSALREFVDEIVVYDTGSTDRTVEIAREHGARVIEGYWNDHFADARNRSIAHCRGEWILVVDADEVISGEPQAMREHLRTATGQARLVLVESLEGHGHEGRGIMSIRVFRPSGRYAGRLHEQVVDGITGASLTGPALDAVELTHSGYTTVRYATKDKGARNVHLAELAVEDHGGSHGALVNLARSQMFAGRAAEAMAVCREALATGGGGYRETFLQVLTLGALASREFDEARSAIARLRERASGNLIADEMEVRLRIAEGDHAGALAILEVFPDRVTDHRHLVMTRRQLVDAEITSLFHLGRHAEAADLLADSLAAGDLALGVAQTVQVLRAAGREVTAIADLVPRRKLRALLLAISEAPAAVADELLEALWARHPGDVSILALAARFGGFLPLLRSLEWAARLRQYGFADSCTLVTVAGAAFRTPRERALAAAVAIELFTDDRAMPLLSQALAEVSSDEAPALLDEMRLLAPGIAAAVEPASVD